MENNRTLKNIILIVIMILSIIAMVITIYVTKDNQTTSVSPNIQSNNNSLDTPPEKPAGDMGEPPTKSEDKKKSDNKLDEAKAPSMGSDAKDSNSDVKEENLSKEKISIILSTSFYIIFSIEALIFSSCLIYLITSQFNAKDFLDTFLDSDKIIIFILATIIITSLIVLGGAKITKSLTPTNKETIIIEDKTNTYEEENISQPSNNTEEIETKGTINIIDENEVTGSYESKDSDESVILVKNGGNASVKDIILNKSGDSTNTEKSDFYGVNSVILVQKESIATIKNAEITSSSKGSNAIFSTGENSKIYLSDSQITTTGGSSSRGLDATYGGYIEADNVTITTMGGSSAILATDRGEGTIKVSNSKLKTNGKGSPIIYSTGDISIDNTEGVANDSQLVVVEGKNSATVNNSLLTAAATGNRNNIDKAGVMIYQSMSGDASEGKGTFTATNSTLTISEKSDVYKTAPMFFVTNTKAEINLTNTKLNYGSNILLSIAGTKEWGKTDANGGDVTLNTNNQTMSGKIIVDSISTLSINLVKTSYKGSINSTGIAKEINLKIDKDSKFTLTADTYLTSLENEDTTNKNIDLNNHQLYVNGTAISQK